MSRSRYLSWILLLTLTALGPGCDDRDPPGVTGDQAVAHEASVLDSSVDAPLPDSAADQLAPDVLTPDLPAPTCKDNKKNGAETDVDCGGGSCPACPTGKGCAKDSDCKSGVCQNTSKTCAKASCSDKVKNGDETDVDCGGSCQPCPDTKGCVKHGDCKSGVCDAKTKTCLQASCTDKIKNGDETDVDCGGGTCPACTSGLGCAKNGDCASSVCDPKTKTCVTGTCSDKVKNGDETDVDCGGGTCPGCTGGLGCAKGADCLSGVCDPTSKTCLTATCSDKVKNGAETDVDCGGGTCPACASGSKCQKAADCKSGVCDATSGTCTAASCTDKVLNGAETDVDCGGGTCPACATGGKCQKAADCTSGVCDPTTNTCTAASCTDKVLNGAETDVDCGGGTCPACAAGKGCKAVTDCASKVCTAGACAAASCSDKVKNGSETHVDCGGSCPIPDTWYLDGDGDSFGGGVGQKACVSPGSKYVKKSGDCDDNDAKVITACTSLGDGSDGALVVSKTHNVNVNASGKRTSPDGVAWRVTANVSGATVKLEQAKGLAKGDLVLLADLQGTSKYVGNWEVLKVASVSGTSVTFTAKPARTYGPASSDRIVVQRIPQYKTLAVNGTLTASAWDGLSKGSTTGRATGIVAVKVRGIFSLGAKGAVNLAKLGFRGGSATLGPEGPSGRVASGGATGGTGAWTLGGAGGGKAGAIKGGSGAASCSTKGGAGGLGGGGGGGKITHCAGGAPPKGGGGGGGGAAHDAQKNLTAASLATLALGGGASAGAGGGKSGANHNASVKTAPGGAPAAGSVGSAGGGVLLLWSAEVVHSGKTVATGGSGGAGGKGESRNGYGSDDGGGGGGEGGQGASGGSVMLHCRALTVPSARVLEVPGGGGGNGGNGGDGYGGGGGAGGKGASFGGSPASGTPGKYKGDGGAAGGGGAGGLAGGAGKVRLVFATVNKNLHGSAAATALLKTITGGGVSSTSKWTP